MDASGRGKGGAIDRGALRSNLRMEGSIRCASGHFSGKRA